MGSVDESLRSPLHPGAPAGAPAGPGRDRTREPSTLGRRYAHALAEYVSGPREDGLQSAYALGRAGIAAGWGMLDFVVVHGRELAAVLQNAPDSRAAAATAQRAGEFLAECLAPFEIMNRGFRESSTELRRLNETLRQRAAELAAANDRIRELSRARSAFLAEAGRRLAASLDFEATLGVIVNLPVPDIAGWCAVDLVDDQAQVRRVASSDNAPGRAGDGGAWTELAACVDRVLADGASCVQAHGERAGAIVVPLAARERVFGALALAPVSHRADGGETGLAEEFGRLAAMALDNARLYREAKQAIRVRDEFLSIASHELRTPLTPLTLRLQLAARRLRQGQPVDLPAMEAAIRHVQRLASLINDLLDVSRIEAGRLQLRLASVALEPLVRELVSTFALSNPDRVIHFDPGPAPMVRADRPRLEQVVTNLLENAVKYSPGGADVWVRLERSDAQAVLSVQDRGIGIPAPQQARVFQRFFRAGNAGPGTFGLGLGLYICHDIVQRHGGRIWVESTEGQGSTFRVALPLDGPAPGTEEGTHG